MASESPGPGGSRRWRNWGGNQHAVAVDVRAPGSVDEVATIVKEASESGRRVKVVGTGHSFTGIAAADDLRMHLSRMPAAVSVARHLITVGAGMPLHALNRRLAARGLALPNLGDIDAQTVAGAISTGTHGTGARHATLASSVVAACAVSVSMA